jgi:DNA-binding GntR family transcriptional regulator
VEDHFALLDAFAAGDAERALEIQMGHITLPLEAFELDEGRPA